jgi:phosphoglycolate phosphatase
VSASAPPPPPIRLAVLDMAGTTVRDDGLVTGAFADALAAVGIAPDDPGNPARLEYVMTTMGQSKIDVFTHLLGDPALAADALVAFDASVASRVEAGAVTPLPGAADAMAELRAHGVAVCLTTGFTADTQQRIISQLGWDDAVDLALAPGDGVRGRPHPDLVLAAVLTLDVDDVRSVAVAGDTTSDLWCGHHAGAGIVAGVLTGAHDATQLATAPHTHLLDSVAALPEVVRLNGT